MIARAALKPGINDNLFDVLSKKVKQMSETDKLCILLFDEIAISPHFEYNRKRDIIKGFVNNGKKNIMKIADHALVFMVRGVQKNYKQPIYYTFCSGSTQKDELEIQIKEVIRKLKSVGLKVVATVCDQGTTNMGAIHNLIVQTKAHHLRKNSDWNKKTFEIDGDEIVPLFDPPHLIKGIRNNLLTKNLTYVIDNKKKIAKWDHIVQLYKENPAYQGIRLLPKLTEYHVNPKKIPKMKVKCATQVFSRSVAVNMGYLADKGILSNDCKDTADTLLFFDELFDSFNGSYENNKKRCGKSLLGALTPSSSHQVVWDNATPILQTMKFVSARTGTSACVPSIRNWLHTIENIKYLKTKLFKEHNLKSLWLRHFNQDPLENFFGSIRNHGARNVNPTSADFEIAFASLLVNNLNNSHSPGANCEKDSCQPLKSLYKLFFSKKTQTNNVTTEINIDHINSHEILTDIYIKLSNPKIKAQLEYVSGFVLKKLKKSFLKCKTCLTNLCDEKRSSEYIRLKDYSKDQKSLTHPSQEFIHLFSSIQDVVTYILRTSSNLDNIKNYFKTILCIVFDFNLITCAAHKNDIIEEILDITCRFFLRSWANNINKILKGARIDVDKDDVMQSQAFNYCLKRKNKLLNK